MKVAGLLLLLPLLIACGGGAHPIVGQWQMDSDDGKANPDDITGGMGDLVSGMRVFTYKEDGTGSVRLGTANEPFDWQVEDGILTRTAKKTTAILKQRVLKATFRIEGDKLILNENGTEVVLKKR